MGGLDDDLLLTMIVVPKFDDDEDEGTFYCIPNVWLRLYTIVIISSICDY